MNLEIINTLVQLNFLPVGICLFLIYFLYINRAYDSASAARFHIIVIQLFGLLILDNLDCIYTDAQDWGTFHLFVVSVLAYISRLGIMASLIDIAIERLDYKRSNLVYIPLLLCGIILLLAFNSGLVNFYNSTGQLCRGALGFLPHITELCYAFILVTVAVRLFFLRKINEAEIVIICLCLVLLGTLLELLELTRNILISIISLVTVFYYLYIHIEHFKFDNLTRVLNRDSFYADVNKLGKDKITAIMSIDLDGLKKVNDTKGHQAGDKMLIDVARIIQKSLFIGCYLYRVGGDEFTVICTSHEEVEIKNQVIKILNNIEDNGYSLSVGYAMWKDDMSFKEVYQEADNKMYKMKEENHTSRL